MTKKDTATAKPKAPKKKTIKKKAAGKKTAVKKAAGRTAGSTSKRVKKPTAIPEEKRRMMVAMRAYYKWENSGRPDNSDTHYWLEAEKEVEDMLR